MTTTERLGANIREFRRRLDLSQDALGERIDSDGPRVSRLENGNENPTIETLDKLCAALHVDVSQLLSPRPEEAGASGELKGSTTLDRLLAEHSTADGSWQSDVAKAIAILAGSLKRDSDKGTGDGETRAPRRGTTSDR